MSTIYLKVKGLAGSEILQVSKEAIELANKVGVSVEFDFNGVVCVARPNESAESLAKNWEQEVSSKKKYKFASSEEVNTVEKPEIDWDGISNQTRKYEYNSDAAEFLKNQFKILQNSLNPEPSSKKEEGWEIVEIVDTYYSNSIISKENKLGVYSLKDYLTKYEKGRFKINAVLRKSDNTVFTVGDEVGYKINDTKFIVKTIKISGEPYLLDGDTFHKHLLPLRNAIKAPTNTVEDKPFVWTDELVERYRFFKPNIYSEGSALTQFKKLTTNE